MSDLPIHAVLPSIALILADNLPLIVEAPPGAGKTTGIPPALLNAPWLEGKKIVMLEPRRLAARAAAARMAAQLGEAAGGTVGYRVRMDSRVSAATRIEVVTEGILTRMIQDDPALTGIGAVIFDEVHERNLDGDLGLALCLETRAALRDDLRLVAMSATLDGGRLATLLGNGVVVRAEGRMFPIDTVFLERPDPRKFAEGVASAIRRALAEVAQGDILVFLPGGAEIRRAQAALAECRAVVTPLYGDLPSAEQDRALRPDDRGRRKVVLATSIAETSLTIEGVRVVVDGGLMRRPRFDPGSGMTRLITTAVSRASADQRRGRAGRLGPGVCYRLWSEADERGLAPYTPPEILEADLAPLALELALWGDDRLTWQDPPPASALNSARELLRELDALDEDGRITPRGRMMTRLGMHPRLAHMCLEARAMGLGGLACDIAAQLTERGSAGGIDLRARLEHPSPAARQAARDWRRRLGVAAGAEDGPPDHAGPLLALAYPDRIGRRRGPGRFTLSQGGGAVLPETDPLAGADWLVAADLSGEARDARIFLAAPLTLAEIESTFEHAISEQDEVAWDPREQAVKARRTRRLWKLTLDGKPWDNADPAQLRAAMAQGVRQLGLDCLPWSDAATALRHRVALLAGFEPGWPDLSDATLLDTLDDWLAPYLGGMTRRPHLDRLDMAEILSARLDYAMRKRLDTLAPTHLPVPSGRTALVDYSGDEPVLAVKLQEMFGCADTPRIANGRVPVLLHLLSPAGRPLQVTRDLAGFWAGSYKAVKAEMKGRYPKHPWPDDPLAAQATARAKPRGT